MSDYVYDTIGNAYPRKNDKSLEYIQQINEIKAQEKHFLEILKMQLDEFSKQMKGNFDSKEIKLRLLLKESKRKLMFYKRYKNKSYDFLLEFKINELRSKRLPEILDLYNTSVNKKIELKNKLKNIDKLENEIKIKEYNDKKKVLKTKLNEEVNKLKLSYKNGYISYKALNENIKQLHYALKDEIEVLKLDIPKENIKSQIRVFNYIQGVEVDSQFKILMQDISDIIRKTPVEKDNISKISPIISFFVPGYGQLLLKQYFKAFMLFLGLIFIYFVAIPYSIGYGNYRGEGLKGLYTLAQNGTKLDKSMIFMIEGLVSIILLLFSITIMCVSYKDNKTVLADLKKGVRPRTSFETIETMKEDGFPYIVNMITFVLLSFIVILPIMTTILLSFAGMDPNNQSKFAWVGLENYKLLIQGRGIAGGPFWLILGWTLIWTVFSTTLSIFVGFGLALLAHNERIKGKTLIRTIYLLPWAVPAFITIMFFSIMSSSNGQITKILENIFGGNMTIKNSIFLTRIALILLQTWLGSSYVFLLSTGVLQGIPSDLYEAADIDGATSWQRLTRITVPLVLFQTAPLLIGQYTFNFNNFSIIYLFNGGGPFDPSRYGNMAGGTDLLISYIYKLTIQKQYQSIGAAITVFISVGLIIFAYIGFKNSKAFKEGK